MQNYIQLNINNYNNLDYVKDINLKLELIKNTISNNKAIQFELYSNNENVKGKNKKNFH